MSGGSILECVIPQNLAENTHEQEVAGWLRVQTVLAAAPDHKNSPHYRLEIKCEGRGRESWTGLIVLENIFLIRGILLSGGGVWPPGTEDILLSGAQFSKMPQHCSGDLLTCRKLNSNTMLELCLPRSH